MAGYRVIILPLAAEGLSSIQSENERNRVKDALGQLLERPENPKPYEAKERKAGWEMHVERWKITYEIRRIELVVYVHAIKESPSWAFDYRNN
jgi:mRNA-degrading endonuclease RelE of RelBE toxin-antitoxin system